MSLTDASIAASPGPVFGKNSPDAAGFELPSNHTWPDPTVCDATGDKCWPTLFVVGAQKAATTSIFELVVNNGLACGGDNTGTDSGEDNAGPDGDKHRAWGLLKEAHFYSDDGKWKSEDDSEPPHVHLASSASLQTYLGRYRKQACEKTLYMPLYCEKHPSCVSEDKPACRKLGCDVKRTAVFMDATPNYLAGFQVAKRMSTIMPTPVQAAARFIIIAREPISRDLSFYNMLHGAWIDHVKAGGSTMYVKPFGLVDELLCSTHKKGAFPTYNQAVSCQLERWEYDCGNGTETERVAALELFSGKGAGKDGKVAKAESGAADYSSYARCALGSPLLRPPAGWDDSTFYFNRLTTGMYSAQLNRYRSQFKRDHILFIQFEKMIESQSEYVNRILVFLSFPAPIGIASRGIPSDNDASFPEKVALSDVPCYTVKRLSKVFDPWNEDLYKILADDQMRGESHTVEPAFGLFPKPECTAVDPPVNEGGSFSLVADRPAGAIQPM